MARPHEQVFRRDAQVTAQLLFEAEASLLRISELKILGDRQCEWKHAAKPRESLVIEALPQELVLRGWRNARGERARRLRGADWSQVRASSPRYADCALEYLR